MNSTTIDNSLWLGTILSMLGYSMSATAENIILVLIPTSLGILSQVACFIVFMRIKTSAPLYKYLKAYTVTNFIICCFGPIQFFYSIYTLGDPKSKVNVTTYFVFTISLSCYLYCTLLDTVILLDRIATFNKRVKEWLKIVSPYKQITLLAVIAIILNIPYFFLLEPTSLTLPAPDGTVYTLWYSGASALASMRGGYIIIIFLLAVNFFGIMFIQIALNIRSVFYLQKHLAEKKTLTQRQNSNSQKVDVKASVMVSILCFMSFAEHILYILCNFGTFFFPFQLNIFLLQKITIFTVGMRRFSDFFFYLKFNKVFKKQLMADVGLLEGLSRTNSATGGFSINRVAPVSTT